MEIIQQEYTREQIEKALNAKIPEAIEVVTVGDFGKLQQASYVYTQSVEDLAKKFDAVNWNPNRPLPTYYAAMRAQEEYTQTALEQMHTFERALNNFMGRVVHLAYVNKDGKIIYKDDLSIEKMYKTANPQYGRGNLSASSVGNESDDILIRAEDEAATTIRNWLNVSQNNKIGTYQEAISRYKCTDSEIIHYKKNKALWRTFWWNKKEAGQSYKKANDIDWSHVINNIGDIAEGYAEAVINEDELVNHDNLERGLYNLWANHIKRNTTPAIIREDVIMVGSHGRLQFAVKSGSFSTARVGQYYRFAKNIQQLEFLDANALQNEKLFRALIKTGKTTEAVIQAIKEDKDINEFLATLNNKSQS